MKNLDNRVKGHIFALFSAILWGTTFISTKTLLKDFTPLEILVTRFLLAYFVLWAICPHKLKSKGIKEELLFAGGGLTGVSLYFLMENSALVYTYASNVSVIVTVAPFFTGIMAMIFLKNGEGKLNLQFFVGFLAAIAGVFLLSFEGSKMHLNPMGDLLALAAAWVWGMYGIFTKKIEGLGYSVLLYTRRIFFYGLIFCIPMLGIYDFSLDFSRYLKPENLFNIVYLGLGASALCYVIWNSAIGYLGAVKSALYIYLIPVVTVIFSAVFLGERLSAKAFLGVLLTMSGMVISEWRGSCRKGDSDSRKGDSRKVVER